MCTTEPLECEPCTSEFEIAIANLTRHESPSIDKIPAELIQAWDIILRSEINKLINSILNMENFPKPWKESIIVPIYMKGDVCMYVQGWAKDWL
jgi:hypothetical protein